MHTFRYLWQYLAKFFLEWEMCRENKKTHLRLNNLFSKIMPFMTMSRNLVEPEGQQMTWEYGAYVVHAE
jgi:hypothetical protein